LSDQPFTRPDVLVLGAGGILGEAWMSSLLAGIEERTGIDFRRTESLVGTSAGSIVAASLVAGRRPPPPQVRVSEARGRAAAPGRGRGRGAGRGGARARAGETYARAAGADGGTATDAAGVAAGAGGGFAGRSARGVGGVAARRLMGAFASTAAPLAPLALSAGAPGGALVRAALHAGAPAGTRTLGPLAGELDRAGARFDGRLRVCCVDRARGRRVVFGAPGAPPARVGEAVAASCAIPSVFRPVRIGGREYVDGGVWSLTNLDAAPVAQDTQVLCLTPTGGVGAGPLSPLAAVRVALRAAEAVEVAFLRRRGARVRVIVPEGEAAQALGFNLMDPRPRTKVAGAGYRQGLAIGGGE
jgi:NTE family protein